MNKFDTNEIVRGVNAGVFVILGTRTIGEESGYQVKAVNPDNLAQAGRGEMFFTPDMLKAY